jgi:hypothetical protein
LPDASVDLVFTDPPFGANINYSEMNILWESWLGRFTDNTHEAIINCPYSGHRKQFYLEKYSRHREHFWSLVNPWNLFYAFFKKGKAWTINKNFGSVAKRHVCT